jgi:hypothetical protein
MNIVQNDRLRIQALNNMQGAMPVTTFRIETGGKAMVITAGTVSADAGLRQLAAKADLLVMPVTGAVANFKPIGQLARDVGVGQLVLTTRETGANRHEQEVQAELRKDYSGAIQLADDLSCFRP